MENGSALPKGSQLQSDVADRAGSGAPGHAVNSDSLNSANSEKAQFDEDERVQIEGEPSGKLSLEVGELTAVAENRQKPNVFASAVLLYMRSRKHKRLLLSDLEWRLLPALSLKQFRLFTKGDRPVGFVTWALVSDEVAERLKTDKTPLKPSDWNSGEKALIIDLVAPFGGEEEIRKLFKGEMPAG